MRDGGLRSSIESNHALGDSRRVKGVIAFTSQRGVSAYSLLSQGDRFLTPWCYMAVKVLLMAVCLALPAAAQAQTAPADGTWRAWAGHDTFRLRDTAKSSPPVDGSPVEWRGAGPILGLAWDRERPFRLHRFDVAFLAAGGFVYDTGIGTIPRPDDPRAGLMTQFGFASKTLFKCRSSR